MIWQSMIPATGLEGRMNCGAGGAMGDVAFDMTDESAPWS